MEGEIKKLFGFYFLKLFSRIIFENTNNPFFDVPVLELEVFKFYKRGLNPLV